MKMNMSKMYSTITEFMTENRKMIKHILMLQESIVYKVIYYIDIIREVFK